MLLGNRPFRTKTLDALGKLRLNLGNRTFYTKKLKGPKEAAIEACSVIVLSIYRVERSGVSAIK